MHCTIGILQISLSICSGSYNIVKILQRLMLYAKHFFETFDYNYFETNKIVVYLCTTFHLYERKKKS
jgi:hypothetical protein